MNLCLACRGIGPGVHSGLARATRDLAVALAERGHSVELLTDSAESSLTGVSVRQVRVSPMPGRFRNVPAESAAFNLMYAAAVYREVKRIHERERRVDAVLAPLWRSEAAVCLLDQRFPTIVSCMTSMQTLTEVDATAQLIPDLAEQLALERETLRRSRYLHGLTEAALRKTIRDHDLTPALTAVIRRGLRDRRAADVEPPSANGRVEVLFVGRLEPRKGVDTLLAAARELVQDGPVARFTLVGPDGEPGFRRTLDQQVGEPHGFVRFLGAISDAELHRLYSRSDVVCAPSRYESHGIVLVEAMMFGKPLVTCDAGGISEVVAAERNALVCEPDDPHALAEVLRRLVADAQLRADLGRSARETYEARFEVRSVARDTERFVEDVVRAHTPTEAPPRAPDDGLRRLVEDTFALPPSEAAELARDLLDPAMAAQRRSAEDEAAESELAQSRAEIHELRRAISAQEESLAFLHARHVTLTRVEEGGWWRLRSHLLPLLRAGSRGRAAYARLKRTRG